MRPAVAFLAVYQCLLGACLGRMFCPNRKGVSTSPATAVPDFLLRQVLASCNVRGGRLIGMMLGRFNYQIRSSCS